MTNKNFFLQPGNIALPGQAFESAFSTARWITIPQKTVQENDWICFRKTITLSRKPIRLPVRIAVDSKYWLWINGRLVVFEGGLKRGPTPLDTYFDEIDLAKHLRPGKNTLAVLIWFWGREGYCHKNSGRAGLLIEAEQKSITFQTDSTWKCQRHPAFGSTGYPFPNIRLPEFNIHFDARLDGFPDWFKPGFNDKLWPSVEVAGKAGCRPWNRLIRRPFPQWKDSGLQPYKNNTSLPKVGKGQPIVALLPKNESITPYLKIDAPAGLLIDMRTDNYNGGSNDNVRTQYVTREGVQEFETPGYMNGHEVIYSIPSGVKILSLRYRRTSYPTDYLGHFTCSDPFLNKLWQKSLNTMDLNMRDAIQDPDRERSQWWGDAVIVLGQILYSCDTSAHGLIQKAISNLIEWRKPDGALYSPVPEGNWKAELPSQMLASVGKYGFGTYCYYTDDRAMAQYVYPHVKRYLSLWEEDDDGLIKSRPQAGTNTGYYGGEFWPWHDWGKDIDPRVIDNAWFALALEGQAMLAELIGNKEQAEKCRRRKLKLKKAFNQTFWNGEAYRSPEHKEATDDRAQGLAVVAGLMEKEQWPKLRATLQKEFHAGPYLEKYVLEAFFQMGDVQGGLDRMKQRYRKMVESPCTTLWEGWDIGSHEYGGGSYNHGWAGGPLTLLSQYVAGVAPLKPGYKLFEVKPRPGALRWIRAQVPTIQGEITVDWKGNAKQSHLIVTVPPKTGAIITVPRINKTNVSLKINGTGIPKPQAKPSKISGCRYLGQDESSLCFQVIPGKWVFELISIR
jgi:alpha-L-rhamnosidase